MNYKENEKEYLSDSNGKPKLTLCEYDKDKGCHNMTKSVSSRDKTHYNCEKCGAIK